MKFVLQSVAAKMSPSLFDINLYFEMEDKIFVIDSQDFKQGVNILYIGRYSGHRYMIRLLNTETHFYYHIGT